MAATNTATPELANLSPTARRRATKSVWNSIVPGAEVVMVAQVLACIFCQRLCVPLPTRSVLMVLPLQYLAFVPYLLQSYSVIDFSRLAAFMVSITFLSLSVLVGISNPHLSIVSFFYLVAIYLPVFCCRFPSTVISAVRSAYVSGMTFCAILGLVQIIAQLFGAPKIDFLALLPSAFLSKDFHNQIPIQYGSDIYKADGLFMLEPSVFSQWLAVALLFELSGRRQMWRCAVFLAAMLASFSGTGFIALAVGLPFEFAHLFRGRPLHALAIAGILAVGGLVLAVTPMGDIFLSRIDEFSMNDSSASNRFVKPYNRYLECLDVPGALFGHGPGTSDELDQNFEVVGNLRDDFSVVVADDPFKKYLTEDVADKEGMSSTIIKLAYEYGLLGVPFLIFICCLYLGSEAPMSVRVCLFVTYAVLGGWLTCPPQVTVSYCLLFLKPNDIASDDYLNFVNRKSNGHLIAEAGGKRSWKRR